MDEEGAGARDEVVERLRGRGVVSAGVDDLGATETRLEVLAASLVLVARTRGRAEVDIVPESDEATSASRVFPATEEERAGGRRRGGLVSEPLA